VNLSSAETERYLRHILLPEVGEAGQVKLKRARVLCVGAGGLGSPALLYLAAAGVGHIGIIDDDVVDITNLQRQIIHDMDAVGTPKVESARDRMLALNPEIEVTTYPNRLGVDNAMATLGGYDVILDGTDNLPTRYLIDDACALLGKPWVYGAVLRFEGQVSVFGWERGPRYRDLFPSPPPAAAVPSCAESGVLGVLPGIIGALQATEVLKLILGLGNPLSGRLWIYDALNAESTTLQLTADTKRPPIQTLIAVELPDACAGHTIHALSPERARERLAQGWNACWIDVRSPVEVSQGQLPHIAHTHAHDTVPRIAHTLPQDRDWVLVCRTGQRASQAAKNVTPPAGHSLWVLEGGMTAWDRSPT
jgi:molybdopterin/thiamine biosynthesis adenylyltransferase/rhodanese-related sulfurtransferase